MAVKSGYSAGSFALEIEGQFAGWLGSVEGGVAYGVVLEKPSGNAPTDKSIAEVKYDDIVFTCGLPEPKLAQWLDAFLSGQAAARNGAIAFLDHNYQLQSRLEWANGIIAALTLPRLDAASTDSGRLAIRIRPESTRSVKGGANVAASPVGLRAKKWFVNNFAVTIPGVSCAKVNSVEELEITQTFRTGGRGAPKPGPLAVGDLVLTVGASLGFDFAAWHEDFLVKGNNGGTQEKSATIAYLAADLKAELFSVNLQPVGIYRLDPSKRTVNVESLARLTATMYCEQAKFAFPTQQAPPLDTVATVDSRDDLREFLGVRLGTEEVARRLRDTRDQPTVTSAADRERQLGIDLGIAWAERRASLAELQELGTIDDDWSGIALPPGHSLSEVLEATGVVPLQYDGRLELSRDSMVEGILAGILKVMSEVSEEITQNMK